VNFQLDDSSADWLDAIVTFVTANILWILTSVPVVTMPMATAGLFAVLVPRVRGQKPEAFAAFFDGVRRYWRQSTLFFVLDGLLGGLVVANVLIIPRMGAPSLLVVLSGAVTLLVGLIAVLVNLYFWPLLVTVVLPLRTLIVMSFRLAMGHLLWSLLIAAGVGGAVILSLALPGFVTVIVAFAGGALWISWGAWRIIARYLQTEPGTDSQDTPSNRGTHPDQP
jgi:uncharacterized membrane protein YesL